MAQGKLISFVPLMKGNVQDTYSGNNGMLYKFTVTLDNAGTQVTGTANSSKQQPSWKINEEYTYEVAVQGNYTNIKNMKSINQAGGFGGGSARVPNPSFVVQKCLEASLECTFKFFELNPEVYKNQGAEDAVLNLFYTFTLKGDEQQRWMNIAGLRFALQKMQANGMFDKTEAQTLTAWTIEKAKTIAASMSSVVKAQVEYEKANPPK